MLTKVKKFYMIHTSLIGLSVLKLKDIISGRFSIMICLGILLGITWVLLGEQAYWQTWITVQPCIRCSLKLKFNHRRLTYSGLKRVILGLFLPESCFYFIVWILNTPYHPPPQPVNRKNQTAFYTYLIIPLKP